MSPPTPGQIAELHRLAAAAIAADVDLDTWDLCAPGDDAPPGAIASYQAEADRLARIDRLAREALRRAIYRTLGPGEAALILDDGTVVAVVDQSDGLGLVPPGRVLRLAGPGQVAAESPSDRTDRAG